MRDLIRSYFTVAVRFLWRNKVYSFINILGLSFGLACSFIVLLYVTEELKYDKHYKNAENIYRVINERTSFANYISPSTSHSLARIIEEQIPEVESVCKIDFVGATTVDSNESIYCRMYSADSSIINFFDLEFLYRSSNNPLADETGIIISERAALKHFGDVNVVGKSFRLNISGVEERTFIINGVFKDMKRSSSFWGEYFCHTDISFVYFNRYYEDLEEIKTDINSNQLMLFLMLKDKASQKNLEAKINQLYKENCEEGRIESEFTLQNIQDIHLHSAKTVNEMCYRGNFENIKYYSLIGFIILFISCFNFSLLNLAKSSARLKEVGIRKAIGATKRIIQKQILAESILLSLLALPNAILLTELMLPKASMYLNKSLQIDYFSNLNYVFLIILMMVMAGIISGSYIAFHISKFDPIHLFHSGVKTKTSKSFFRKAMITIQMTIFIALISIVLLMNKQIGYIYNKDIGIQKDNLVLMYPNEENPAKILEFKNKLKTYPSIDNATSGQMLPPDNSSAISSIEHPKNKDLKIETEGYWVDHDFFETYGVELLEGRLFDKNNRSDDSLAIIINETAVKAFDFGDSALTSELNNKKIIGVVKDFHLHTLHMIIRPMYIYLDNESEDRIVVAKIKTENRAKALEDISKEWNEFFPEEAFKYYSFNDALEGWHDRDFDSQKTFITFSVFAVLIALLGLFGFTLFTVERRSKEIAIRKIQGASTFTIIKLITKEFAWQIIAGMLLSTPLAYLFISQWLERFAYRVTPGPIEFMLSFIIALIIVFPTISIRAAIAARKNPVKYLKYE